jgi:hypothetical protein
MRQGQESIWTRLGKAMQGQAADATHEPLPRRWVDLIHHLDEQERRRSGCRQPAAEQREWRQRAN